MTDADGAWIATPAATFSTVGISAVATGITFANADTIVTFAYALLPRVVGLVRLQATFAFATKVMKAPAKAKEAKEAKVVGVVTASSRDDKQS